MSPHRSIRNSGFTLIEVIIATAVVAFALAAVIQTTSGGASNIGYLRDKTFSHWVAMNQLSNAQVQQPRVPIGRSNGESEMAGRIWYWWQEVKTTEDPQVRRVEIKVRREDNEKSPNLVTMVGLLDLPVINTQQGGSNNGGQSNFNNGSGDITDVNKS